MKSVIASKQTQRQYLFNMISERFEDPCVDTPWDNNNLYIMNYHGTCAPSIPWENSIIDNRKVGTTYWILVNWECEWLDQHKDYRPCGDYAKLLDDLYWYRGLAFAITFDKDENDKWSYMIVEQPKCYTYEMWDGDQRYMETVSIEECSVDQEDIDDALRQFESRLQL